MPNVADELSNEMDEAIGRLCPSAGEFPMVSRLARFQALESYQVANLNHQTVGVSDIQRQLRPSRRSPVLDSYRTKNRAGLTRGSFGFVHSRRALLAFIPVSCRAWTYD
jgi:hypothetical protein